MIEPKTDIRDARETVGDAFSEFEASCSLADANEHQTRVHLVDRVLTAVGWRTGETQREQPTGVGDFLDYALRTEESDGTPWLVVEVKRRGRTFRLDWSGSNKNPSLVEKVRLLIKNAGQSLRDAIKQAAHYCNDTGCPYACVTNGFQWVFFRGLSKSKKIWQDGNAVVFPDRRSVLEHFDTFYGCIARHAVLTNTLPQLLDLPTKAEVPQSLVPRNSFQVRRRRAIDSAQSTPIGMVATQLLGNIHGDPNSTMLEECYVDPGPEDEFARTVQRLLRDSAASLEDWAERVDEGRAEEFAAQLEQGHLLGGIQAPVVVAGHVGVGKTTFLHRTLAAFRQTKAPQAIAAFVDLEGRGRAGLFDARVEQARLASEALEKLGRSAQTAVKHAVSRLRIMSESELQQADPFSPEALRTMYRHLLDRERRLGEAHYSNHPQRWDERELEVFRDIIGQPKEHLTHFVRHAHRRFKRNAREQFPVLLVLDNVDQASDDFQRLIYGFALQLAQESPAIVVIAMREETLIHKGHQALAGSGPIQQIFHVASPPLKRLLRRREAFARALARPGSSEKHSRLERSEREHILKLCDMLRDSLLCAASDGLRLIAQLAGHDTRRALDLARGVLTGAAKIALRPDASAEFVFDALLASVGSSSLLRSYGVANCFDARPTVVPCHALRVRLLAYFDWAREQGNRTYLEMRHVAEAKFAAWGYPLSQVVGAIDILIQGGLLSHRTLSPDRAQDMYCAGRDAVHLRLTASGHAHLNQLLSLRAYRTTMACTTRWYDADSVNKFIKVAEEAGGVDGPTIGDITHSHAPVIFEAYLSEYVGRENRQLVSKAKRWPWALAVLTRSSGLVRIKGDLDLGDTLVDEQTQMRLDALMGPTSNVRVPSKEERDQLSLDIDGFRAIAGESQEPLARISLSTKIKNTVDVPRILWALEWARRHGQGPRTSTEMADILKTYGDLEAYPTNIARGLRNRKKQNEQWGFWRQRNKRYEITETGTMALLACLLGSPEDGQGD